MSIDLRIPEEYIEWRFAMFSIEGGEDLCLLLNEAIVLFFKQEASRHHIHLCIVQGYEFGKRNNNHAHIIVGVLKEDLWKLNGVGSDWKDRWSKAVISASRILKNNGIQSIRWKEIEDVDLQIEKLNRISKKRYVWSAPFDQSKKEGAYAYTCKKHHQSDDLHFFCGKRTSCKKKVSCPIERRVRLRLNAETEIRKNAKDDKQLLSA